MIMRVGVFMRMHMFVFMCSFHNYTSFHMDIELICILINCSIRVKILKYCLTKTRNFTNSNIEVAHEEQIINLNNI